MGKKLYPSNYAHEFQDFFIWPQSLFFIIWITKKNLLIARTSFCDKTKTIVSQGQLFYRDRQFWIPAKRATQSTDIKPTPGSVDGDIIGSWSSPVVISATPSTCTRIASFPTSEDVGNVPLSEPSSPLCKSTQFCKSTTVMTVVLTRYMKQNSIKTISCSVKTDNSFFFMFVPCISNIKIRLLKSN